MINKTKKLNRFARVGLGFCLMSLIIPFSQHQSLLAQETLGDDAFDFVDHLVQPIHGQSNYLTKTNVAVDDRGDFRVIQSHLYSNALAAIVMTHRWKEEGNPAHLDKATGILKTLQNFQYPSTDPTVEGAFPNLLVSEDYHVDPGPTPPYSAGNSARAVRNGSNGWYLMALGYYTLETGDRQFVAQLEALADYFSSPRAQDQTPGSPTKGAIFFGWGSYNEPLDVRKAQVSTEHQTEAFAGLLYAAEVMKDEPGGALKAEHYLECAYSLLKFTINKLYNPNNPGPGVDPLARYFHVGYTASGAISPDNTALDAQTFTNLAFSRVLEGIEDITDALDYAWYHMYGSTELSSILGVVENEAAAAASEAKLVIDNYDNVELEAGETRLQGGTYLGPFGGGTAVVTPLPNMEAGSAALKIENYGGSWGIIHIKNFAATDVSDYEDLEFSFLSEGNDSTRTVQIQLAFENPINGGENTWNWSAPPTLSTGYNQWTNVRVPLNAANFQRSVGYVEGNDFDLTRLNRIAVIILNNGAAAGTEAPVYVDGIKLVKSIVDPCSVGTSFEVLTGIDQLFGVSSTVPATIARGALWYEGDKGIWLAGSAQLAYAFDYNFNYLDGDSQDQARGQFVYNDMSAMEWPADSFTVNARTYHWPKGGFQVFSDGYNSNTEPIECIRPEAVPNVEPTAWRYFDVNDLNPYAVLFSTPMAAPTNFGAVDNGIAGISLSWDTDPMAVSYCIMRNGEVIGFVSNLDNMGSTFVDDSPLKGSINFYTVAARDLSGQLGAASSEQSIYVKEIKLLANDGAIDDRFGSAVALSGNMAIVGAHKDDDNGKNSGSVYLMDIITGTQMAKLLPNDGAKKDNFGYRIAVDSNIAVITAIGDNDNGRNSGSAYLFDITTGTQLHKLLPNDGAKKDRFGSSAAIDGNIVIIGAFKDDDNGLDSGSAYLFDVTTGQQLHKLLPADGAEGDRFGRSVAIDGNLAIVGAHRHDGSGHRSGAAYVFDVTTGAQLFKLLPTESKAMDHFGRSVAIDGDTILVTAHRDSTNGRNSGAAYLFDASTGTQLFKLLPSDGARGDRFGFYAVLEGDTVVIGSKFDDDNGKKSGSAYVFDVSTGIEIDKLLPSDGAAREEFGWHVGIDGDKAIVGAVKDDDNGYRSGSAYIFDLP